MSTNELDFFAQIPPIYSIADATVPDHYHDVPDDWYIAITDVRGSTRAIEAGRYKDVNAVAAATITAMMNHVPGVDLPFVFGGDGATILLPPDVIDKARESLLATRHLAEDSFDLELRIGIVPVRDVLEQGHKVRVARLWLSEHCQQAVFTGGGLTCADQLLKDPMTAALYNVIDTRGNYEADFTGFECRWRKLPSPQDEVLSLMVIATGSPSTHYAIYADILHRIETIYGSSQARRPVTESNLHISFLPRAFRTEAALKHRDTSFRMLAKLAYKTFLARIAMMFNIQNWGIYKRLLAETTDSEKFDDMLRMIIAGKPEQRTALLDWLDAQQREGRLLYGTHVSKHALVTCIIQDYFGRQVHFVDGADGGYTMAARQLKGRMGLRVTAEIPQITVTD
jgi:hypothetical protein